MVNKPYMWDNKKYNGYITHHKRNYMNTKARFHIYNLSRQNQHLNDHTVTRNPIFDTLITQN